MSLFLSPPCPNCRHQPSRLLLANSPQNFRDFRAFRGPQNRNRYRYRVDIWSSKLQLRNGNQPITSVISAPSLDPQIGIDIEIVVGRRPRLPKEPSKATQQKALLPSIPAVKTNLQIGQNPKNFRALPCLPWTPNRNRNRYRVSGSTQKHQRCGNIPAY